MDTEQDLFYDLLNGVRELHTQFGNKDVINRKKLLLKLISNYLNEDYTRVFDKYLINIVYKEIIDKFEVEIDFLSNFLHKKWCIPFNVSLEFFVLTSVYFDDNRIYFLQNLKDSFI